MRQSRTEIKAIEAELKSIRAERSPSKSVKLLNVNGMDVNGTEVEIPCPHPSTPASARLTAQNEQLGSATLQDHKHQAHKNQDPSQEYKPRRIECFPIPAHSSFEYPDVSMERNSAPASRRSTNPRRSKPQHNSPPAAVLSVSNLEEQLAAISPWQDGCFQEELVQGQLVQEQLRGKPGKQVIDLQKQNFIQQLIEEKANQINQLSNQQETAILELIQISDQIEPEGEQAKRQLKRESVQILEYQTAELPYVERNDDGTLVLTHRPIYQPRSVYGSIGQPTDSETGQKLPQQSRRSRSRKRHRWFYGIGRYGWRLIRGRLRSSNRDRLDKIESSRDAAVAWEPALSYPQASQVTSFSLQQAVLLVVASALVRFLLDQLVVIYPVLWIPSVIVMVLPAALAVHRSAVKPPVGFVWGYRLFAILIGLLLGGRL